MSILPNPYLHVLYADFIAWISALDRVQRISMRVSSSVPKPCQNKSPHSSLVHYFILNIMHTGQIPVILYFIFKIFWTLSLIVSAKICLLLYNDLKHSSFFDSRSIPMKYLPRFLAYDLHIYRISAGNCFLPFIRQC